MYASNLAFQNAKLFILVARLLDSYYVQFDLRHFEQQGVGLGLILGSLLVRLREGTLTIHSEAEQGTTVSVAFKRNANVHKHPENPNREMQAAQVSVSA